jgi:hypothetical protein
MENSAETQALGEEEVSQKLEEVDGETTEMIQTTESAQTDSVVSQDAAQGTCRDKCEKAGWSLQSQPHLHEQCLQECLHRFNENPRKAAVSTSKNLALAAKRKRAAEAQAWKAKHDIQQAGAAATKAAQMRGVTMAKAADADAELHAAQVAQSINQKMSDWASKQSKTNVVLKKYQDATQAANQELKKSHAQVKRMHNALEKVSNMAQVAAKSQHDANNLQVKAKKEWLAADSALLRASSDSSVVVKNLRDSDSLNTVKNLDAKATTDNGEYM